MSLEPCNINF
uniref:Uncharacterized protein n=1 Tax=Arundo donax TaxID=35708 RepID=A0A0A9H4T3_ARUDO